MPRPKKYPDYDPEKVMNELLEAVSALYRDRYSLKQISDELDMDWQKVRKLVCTANYRGMINYKSDMARVVLRFYKRNKTVDQISSLTGLSRSSVHSYLPYTKVPYKESEISASAARLRLFRGRKQAVKELKEDPDKLWETITLFQGYPFQTVSGLKFQYTIQGGEMTVDRKEKTITRSTVELAYQKALSGDITGPKQLGVFGASYLYPVLVRIGVIAIASENIAVPKEVLPIADEGIAIASEGIALSNEDILIADEGIASEDIPIPDETSSASNEVLT